MIMENELVRVFREFAPRRQPLSALEIGGGNSCFLPRLMAEFQIAPYTLLDRSEEGMRLARERFGGAYGGRVDYAFTDVFNAQVNRKYDVVFSVGLLEHFDAPQIDELIRLHKRWVRDDGLVLIAVPTPTPSYHVVRWIAEVLGLWQFHDERPIARRRLVDLMRRRQLTILSERTLWLQLLTQSVIAARPEIEEKLEAAG
jgi:cyclopropane fatty-acyl-phospholipid synthase-like methyltransferase